MSTSLTFAMPIAVFFCSLTAGFLFAFAAVVMPGLGRLDDAEFLRAFQVVDRVIQLNQPLFMMMWVGSIVALLAAVGIGFGTLSGLDRWLLLGAGVIYLGGVQLPTATINIPLNNRLQRLNIGELDSAALLEARESFEARWNRWNVVRTGLAMVSVAMLLWVLIRM